MGAREDWLERLQADEPTWAAPDDDRYWSRHLDTASHDELRNIQEDKLRLAVACAYAEIPFYRDRFDEEGLQPGDIRTLDDLTSIPVTTKQDMAADLEAHEPWGRYTAIDDSRWRERGWQTFASSGTTGRPRSFRYTQLDRRIWSWTDARAMWAMGFRPERDVATLAFGYGPHVWLWGVHYALNHMGIPIITTGGMDSRTRARSVADYGPTILACTPSYALYLGSVLREMGTDPASTGVRYLFCAGEPGFSVPATRARIERMWDAQLHEFYGCTEAAPSAGGYTCEAVAADKERASTHLMDDTHIWEVVDPDTLEPVPDGQPGLSVVTNLCSEASPQLRFLVGDFATLTRETCACGRTHTRADGGFVGRADDMLNIRGVTLFPSAVEDAVRRVAGTGEEFEIVVSTAQEMDVLTVRVEAADGGDGGDLAARVESEVVGRCELRPVVEVVAAGTLPRTEFKAKRVRDVRGDDIRLEPPTAHLRQSIDGRRDSDVG